MANDIAQRDFKVNSQLLPPNFPREFDAHIYFDEKCQTFAGNLREKALQTFQTNVFTGEMIPVAIGPHPQPMFEINFPRTMFTEMVLWLERERGDLPVLVHELTGNELYDHTQAALWLGRQLPLKYNVFDGFTATSDAKRYTSDEQPKQQYSSSHPSPPIGSRRNFHAHVYFQAGTSQQALADTLQGKIATEFKDRNVFAGRLIPRAIGPHPVGMFEIDFAVAMFGELVLFLERERGELSVLVHELTGDAIYDHTQAALWLGPQQPLDFSIL